MLYHGFVAGHVFFGDFRVGFIYFNDRVVYDVLCNVIRVGFQILRAIYADRGRFGDAWGVVANVCLTGSSLVQGRYLPNGAEVEMG